MIQNGDPHHLHNINLHQNRVRFISNFRNPDEQLKQKPYPMTNIDDVLLEVEGFQYATPLDLRMGYYHIRLRKAKSNLCTIILPWKNIITNIYQW